MGIAVIYLFGSYAQNQTHPLSDVDIGVVFENSEKYKDKTMRVYLKLYEIFSDLLPKEYLKQRFQKKEHEFDIVFLQFVPFGFQFEAIKKGVVLYEKSKKKRFKRLGEVSRDYQKSERKGKNWSCWKIF